MTARRSLNGFYRRLFCIAVPQRPYGASCPCFGSYYSHVHSPFNNESQWVKTLIVFFWQDLLCVRLAAGDQQRGRRTSSGVTADSGSRVDGAHRQ
jgi:hypothetical protein